MYSGGHRAYNKEIDKENGFLIHCIPNNKLNIHISNILQSITDLKKRFTVMHNVYMY